ncbi:dipeptidase PepV [Caldisericum exile]|uniref:Peptidase PepV n=1 Tax=Caldisericum exile (strain DSM 21853 / NBRC 104410 / AZM16c01) TaxID=511051 RepID=A0A7U6GDQ0_CALEA|nr:dipeptidase PepV [Caldisericum exile]BAL80499.1 putative peptidase PepV [Caldisericum exile AZM16c01]
MEKFIDENKQRLVEITQEIIRIPSVEDNPTEGAPFGENVKNALLLALQISKDLGFRTVNIDNIVGYAEFGEGKDVISVLGHLDVVPEGTGWTYPPYGAEIHDGKIYGRGAIDDKGPTMAALFGAYTLKETGAKLSKRIRIVFGTNEETGWKCMAHFKNVVHDPLIGFTPDAEFPLINREKGILNVTLRSDFNSKNEEVKITGGNRPNMVPDYAKAEFNDEVYLKDLEEGVEVKGTIVEAHGKSAHGALPEQGVNAIVKLSNAIVDVVKHPEVKKVLEFIVKHVGTDVYGGLMGIANVDSLSGKLTMNLGVIEINESSGILTFNIRYPISDNFERIIYGFNKVAEVYGLKVSEYRNQNPLYVKEDSELVKILLNVFEKTTGRKGYTLSIGGGTYARAMDLGVAFGPTFEEMEKVEHMANEYIAIDHLVNLAKIYGNALYELAK